MPKIITGTPVPPNYTATCLICGEDVALDPYQVEHARHVGHVAGLFVCRNCKKAVQFARRMREGKRVWAKDVDGKVRLMTFSETYRP